MGSSTSSHPLVWNLWFSAHKASSALIVQLLKDWADTTHCVLQYGTFNYYWNKKLTIISFITEHHYSKFMCCLLTRVWWRILISCQKCVQRKRRDGAYLCVVGGGVLCFAEHLPVPGCAASSADGSRANTFLWIDGAVFKSHNFSCDAFHQVGEDGFGSVNLKMYKLCTCLCSKLK